MAIEPIEKLSPWRTMDLQGFNGRGCSAAFHSATASQGTLSGVVSDFGDAIVLKLWNMDDFYGHKSFQYLPDSSFVNMVATFDLNYNGQLQGIDSPKNPWTAWDVLSYVLDDSANTSGTIKLWDHATLQSGSFTPASATWTLTAGNPLNAGDRLVFYYLDIPFEYVVANITAAYTYFAGGTGTVHTVRVSGLNLSISAATNATPVQITTTTAHGMSTGDIVKVDQCTGNTGANGDWFIIVLNPTQFTLSSSTGNGAYTGGGKTGLRRQYNFTEGAGLSGRDVAAGIASAISGDPWAIGVAVRGNPITNATNASPIQITTTSAHGLVTGNAAEITGVVGNTAANSAFIITVIDSLNFTLQGSTGNGAYVSGGTITKTNVAFITGAGTDGTEIIIDDATDGNASTHIFNIGLATIIQNLSDQINHYNWNVQSPPQAITASNPSGNDLKIQAARYGSVNTAGSTVNWVSGYKFTGVAAGSTFYLNNIPFTVSSVTDPKTIVLTTSAGTQTGIAYLAEYGGDDGNMISIQVRSASSNLTTSGDAAFGDGRQNSKQLAGGTSNVTWRVSIDFTALSIDHPRLLWLTFAPKLANGVAFTPNDFDALISNISVTDPSSHRPLKVAHPVKSNRIHSRDASAIKVGSWVIQAGFYQYGFAYGSLTTNDTVTVRYSCQHTHNLYLGTALYVDRGKVGCSLDGAAEVEIDTYLNTLSEVVSRRLITASVPAGVHTIVIRVKGTKNAASSGFTCYFNFVEAAVLDDVQDPVNVYTDVTAAIDYGTNHGFGQTPQKLVWSLQRMGFTGPMKEYISVFSWNQRVRSSGTNRSYSSQIGGTWIVGDYIQVTISGITIQKTIQTLDVSGTDATIARKILAQSIVDWINAEFVGVYANVTGAGFDTITIYTRTAIFGTFTVSAVKVSLSGTITNSGNLNQGSEGVWMIDDSATPYLNHAAHTWQADFYAEVAAAGMNLTVASSMELLNPPDNPPSATWSARYNSGLQVITDVGFGTEAQAAITNATNASPIVITAEANGYNSGDRITIAGVFNNTAANGVWPINRLTADTFSLNGSIGNGTYVGGGLAERNLRTTQCAFVPAVTSYQKKVFNEIAGLMLAAGLIPDVQHGEYIWWFFPEVTLLVTNASNTSPITITCPNHSFTNGSYVITAGIRGNVAANGVFAITNSTTNTFDLVSSHGSGAFATSPSATARGGSMGFYDHDTKAAGLASLGRALHVFNTQADPDYATWAADTAFLASQVKTHIDDIHTYVSGNFPTTKYELLFPDDVANRLMYFTIDFPYPQGGPVNYAVNWPAAYNAKSGSGLDHLSLEGLSWLATYHNSDLADATMLFPTTTPNSWAKSDYHIYIPVMNGSAAWQDSYLFARKKLIGPIVFWANDQIALLGLDLPLPVPATFSEIS